ncbi:MAG: hypothetical protein OEV06_10675, partial [Anaerolineae bacterium]|nr:hypothetical protein [Anaerolineae bacterium]
MNPLTIIMIVFIVLEMTNVLALYFFPGTKYANAAGVFNAWEKSKADPEIHAFVKYLVNWVAGTKLIFIFLMIVILVAAGDRLLVYAGVALVTAIASFYWRLFPLIRKMDESGQIQPNKYSVTLGCMIGFIIMVSLSA